MRGFGATTGVASLLMFLGADPPSFSFGLGCVCCCGGGGGGGAGLLKSKMLQRILRIAQVDLAREMQEREQQRRVDRDNCRDRTASVARTDVRSISHIRLTRTLRGRCEA